MQTSAIVFEQPGALALKSLSLRAPSAADVVVETMFSGISTGTEKMLFQGTMPAFPGMRYPLVPGYESVARVVEAGSASGRRVGDQVFVPGASCYEDAAGLFGASASRLVVAGARTTRLEFDNPEEGALLALAATAHHAVRRTTRPVSLVIGHGVLGRLIARIILAIGNPAPTVWETAQARRQGARGYAVIEPASDEGSSPVTPTDAAVIDASGNIAIIDRAISTLQKGGELVLAGFYPGRVSFNFAPAFMREATLAIATEFTAEDVGAVLALIGAGSLSLDGLITHHATPANAETAYRTAFEDPDCLKMIIDWRNAA
jgi:3-hydroxyethyl bacteriochlorophyllide a dehydrogenase